MNGRTGVLALAYLVVAVVGATVLAVSAYYLWTLALLAGMPPALAWTLPVALDAGAIGATVCWVAAPGRAKAWGQGIALGALAATVSGNILAHLIDFQMLPVTPALVIGLGAVYPAVLWLMVHLALVLRTEQSEAADARHELTDARAVREAGAAEQRAHAEEMTRLRAAAESDVEAARLGPVRREELVSTTPTAPARRRATRTTTTSPRRGGDITAAVAWAVRRLAAGETAGWRSIAAEFGLSEHGAKKAARQAKQQHEQTPRLHAVGQEA